MQRYCTELTERLLKSLDKEYNVVDMGAVVDVITALEKTTITKEVLEITRLGKYINELRRKTNNDALAKRAKDLVRRWRDMVLPSAHTQPQPTPADTAPQALNGTKPQSPAFRGLKPQSPATFRPLKPQSPALKSSLKQPHSPLMRDTTSLKQVLSPALSLHSDQSRSPNLPSSKHHQQPAVAQTASTTTNNRLLLNSTISPKIGPISAHNHTVEAVPRTHSSNKRLRKDETTLTENCPLTPPPLSGGISLVKTTSSLLSSQDSLSGRLEPSLKRQRLNGENPPNFPITDTTTTTTTTTIMTTTTTTFPKTSTNNIISRGLTNSSTINQQVPSQAETEKTDDRVPEVPNPTESYLSTVGTDPALAVPSGPKKRGRKKGSKSIKNQALPEDRVKEKLASISRNPKLKTTQELLADLQARGSSASSRFGTAIPTGVPSRSTEPPSTEEILRNAANDERPLSSRYLRLKREKSGKPTDDGTKKHRGKSNAAGVGKRWDNLRKSDNDDDDSSQIPHEDSVDNNRTRELSVEEILAKLPPLDRDAISWSDSDEKVDENKCEERERREICDDDIERLHSQCIEGLNGNFQEIVVDSKDGNVTTMTATATVTTTTMTTTTTTTTLDEKGANEVKIGDIRIEESIDDVKSKSVYRRLGEKENNRVFREWHEMLASPSYDGQILHILPYVIID